MALFFRVQQPAMRIFHFAFTCKRRTGDVSTAFFFHGAEKRDIGMKVKAETPGLGRERRASPGMTRLMRGILLGGKTLAHIPEGLELAL